MQISLRPGFSAVAVLASLSLVLACPGPQPKPGKGDGGDGGEPDAGLLCGNGVLDPGEACDDGNRVSADGCDIHCQVESPAWTCSTVGERCTFKAICGDSYTETGEQCDDGNTTPGDGCSATCQIEPGYQCSEDGLPCVAALCGDGIVAGTEECDDGNTHSGDGCDANCRIEVGYKCDTGGSPCQKTVCGDGKTEGLEQCDDGNNDMGDGCAPDCTKEPVCSNGTCESHCGDGIILPNDTTEECDDGNQRNGDGCSKDCKIEKDWTCTTTVDTTPNTIVIPTVFRDLRGNDLSGGHPDFENKVGDEKGIVMSALGGDHKPQYAKGDGTGSNTTHGKTSFDQWYHDSAMSKTIVSQLVLPRQADGSYVFDNQFFFPLDALGWVALGQEPLRGANDGKQHNFSFTSEARYWFQYKGNEVLTFRGDDDVWVFINGHLALDLGGVHGAEDGSVNLKSQESALGLHVGGIYEAVVWQAERHTVASSYKLTLNNFEAKRSVCKNLCGDGIVETDQGEVCDDGNNVNGDGCSATCQPEIN